MELAEWVKRQGTNIRGRTPIGIQFGTVSNGIEFDGYSIYTERRTRKLL